MCVVAIDPSHRFDSLWLYGNELSLVLFELLLICAVDSHTHCFITDAVITYIVMEVSTHTPHILSLSISLSLQSSAVEQVLDIS